MAMGICTFRKFFIFGYVNRFVIIFLLFLYMIPAIGISVSAHYFGGRLASVTLHLPDKDKCVCGNKKKAGCCKTKTAFIKFKDVHKNNPQIAFSANKEFSKQPAYHSSVILSIVSQSVRMYNFANAHPPDDPGQDIYLVNRVFRI